MARGMFDGLARELFEPGTHSRHDKVRQAALDPYMTYHAADIFGNDSPRPPKKALWDRGLEGGHTLAWYVDPQEVKMAYPREGLELEEALGPDPVVAINPDVLRMRDEKYAMSVIDHEKVHGSQPGKMILKKLYARTPMGHMPLGEMIIEGGVEWALERAGKKPPSRFMEEYSKHTPLYAIYRNFVSDLESKQKGVVRQIYRAAQRGGPNAVARIIESVPGIDGLINEYAEILLRKHERMN